MYLSVFDISSFLEQKNERSAKNGKVEAKDVTVAYNITDILTSLLDYIFEHYVRRQNLCKMIFSKHFGQQK